uniref:Uncharacterized protein n=1 Tax=Mus spicilegus TaxID=10103 RepID=A0A8C6N4S7_MUSSI
VAPFTIIDLAARRPQLDAPGAHVQQKVEVTIQQLHGKVVGPLGRTVTAYPGPGPPALAEEQQPIGLSGSEVQGDGTGALGAPAGQCDKGLRTLKVFAQMSLGSSAHALQEQGQGSRGLL